MNKIQRKMAIAAMQEASVKIQNSNSISFTDYVVFSSKVMMGMSAQILELQEDIQSIKNTSKKSPKRTPL